MAGTGGTGTAGYQGLVQPVYNKDNLDVPFQQLTSISTTLGSTDWVAGTYSARGLWVNLAGNIKVLMVAEQPGNDANAVTLTVTAGPLPISVRKVYKTGTDTAMVTAGIFVGF